MNRICEFDQAEMEKQAGKGNSPGCIIAAVLMLILVFASSLIPFFVMYRALSGASEFTGENCTVPVQATVIRVETKSVALQKRSVHTTTVTAHTPVYSFVYGGTEYEIRSSISGDRNDYAVGDTVELLINPENPYEVYNPKDRSALIIGCLATLVLPALVVIVPLSTLIIIKFKQRKKHLNHTEETI